MAACRWPAVVDALLAVFDTAGIPAWDAEPATDAILTGVIVGAKLDNDQGLAGRFTQGYHDLGPAATRDESGVVHCVALAQTGDDDVKAARTTVFEVLSDVEDALRADPTLGLGSILRVEVAAGEVMQGRSPDGVFAELPFDITYTAII